MAKALVKVEKLQAGDECQFNGYTDTITEVWNDPEGIWIRWESGECGYSTGRFLVVNV